MGSFPLSSRWLAVILAATLGAAPALAGPPDHAGGGKGKQERKADRPDRKADRQDRKADRRERGDDDRRQARDARQPRAGAYFDDRDRESVRRYYSSYSGKSCPPGLAKKNNGCMPPGQAKKWDVGRPLPSDVVFYSVPQTILVSLPPPPPQHRYVRVAGDILLIAIGTGMVVDGINGLLN